MRRVFVPLLLCSPRRGRGRRGCKRGLNSFRVNSPSRIQWERRQYRAEGTIHIEFKADFPGSQRIIRLRDRDALPEGENGQDEYSMLNSAAESRRKKSDGAAAAAAAAAAAGGGKRERETASLVTLFRGRFTTCFGTSSLPKERIQLSFRNFAPSPLPPPAPPRPAPPRPTLVYYPRSLAACRHGRITNSRAIRYLRGWHLTHLTSRCVTLCCRAESILISIAYRGDHRVAIFTAHRKIVSLRSLRFSISPAKRQR